MSREIRRVPVDFDWPHNKVWDGYLMPEALQPLPCGGCTAGRTASREWVRHLATMLLMLDGDLRAQQLGRPLHPYLVGADYGYNRARPGADIAAFGTGLAGREAGWIGHDSTDSWHAELKLIEAAGLDPDVWGLCPTCGGTGSVEVYPGQKYAAAAWEPTDPPTGDGWQLWETVSEGSPISPVFADREGLVDWLTSPAYTHGTSVPMSREGAEGFVDAGWAPSGFASAATGFIAGEQVYEPSVGLITEPLP